mmetsp:Transcript_48021/g.71551  ORF Transcript_48021/g.71551 Transcript_48021/m.71551 type:complete len:209 (-) Transcript_48021:3513-4139(-)
MSPVSLCVMRIPRFSSMSATVSGGISAVLKKLPSIAWAASAIPREPPRLICPDSPRIRRPLVAPARRFPRPAGLSILVHPSSISDSNIAPPSPISLAGSSSKKGNSSCCCQSSLYCCESSASTSSSCSSMDRTLFSSSSSSESSISESSSLSPSSELSSDMSSIPSLPLSMSLSSSSAASIAKVRATAGPGLNASSSMASSANWLSLL